jgi:hypothetical protein
VVTLDTATLAMAIGVIREGSINGVARLIGRPTSSVAMLLNGSKVSWGSRLPCAKIAPSLTLAGEKSKTTLRRPLCPSRGDGVPGRVDDSK